MRIPDSVFTAVLFLIGVSVVGVVFAYPRSTYTSPGTMVQLATSHVPTERDIYYQRFIYPKLVRKEIAQMTGGDPGPLAPVRLSWLEENNMSF
jgi:hypothetical protein